MRRNPGVHRGPRPLSARADARAAARARRERPRRRTGARRPALAPRASLSLLLLQRAALLAAATSASVACVGVVQTGLLTGALFMLPPARQLLRTAREQWHDSGAGGDARPESPPFKVGLSFSSLIAIFTVLAAALGHRLEGQASPILREDDAVPLVVPSVLAVASCFCLLAVVTVVGRYLSHRRQLQLVFCSGSGFDPFALPFGARVSDFKKRMALANAEVPAGASAGLCADDFFLICDGKALQDDECLLTSTRPVAEIQIQVGHVTVERGA